MKPLLVNDLVSELQVIPGDILVMLSFGNMAAWAQDVVLADYVTRIEITGHPAPAPCPHCGRLP
jgi:hypothetical protein